ncbi:MAG: YiiX/YebB-like N1pC/P60 family cysteine hydrolase [Bacteriovorax sp.]|nr:YiiX/YebB-like N1pC/P60 family cysteine hydrolase [Bacteriovorax sp.]
MKKYLFFIVSIFLIQNISWALDLMAGDVLLISFNCYECRVIENETDSPFSHSGVIVKNETNELLVGQSLGSVALYPLAQFLKNKTAGSSVAVFRPREFQNLTYLERISLEKKMLDVFNSVFKGAPFDVLYKWNNFDKQGRELLYCSEFIAKFLDHFLGKASIPYPLTYDKNQSYWFQYFHGVIPEGELGNSPASFSRDERFVFIGNL